MLGQKKSLDTFIYKAHSDFEKIKKQEISLLLLVDRQGLEPWTP